MQTTLLESAALPEFTLGEQKFPILIKMDSERFNKKLKEFERSLHPYLHKILAKYNELELDQPFDTNILKILLTPGSVIRDLINEKVERITKIIGRDLARNSLNDLNNIYDDIQFIKENLFNNYYQSDDDIRSFDVLKIQFIDGTFIFFIEYLDEVFNERFSIYINNQKELDISKGLKSFEDAYNKFVSLCAENNYPRYLIKINNTFLINFFNESENGELQQNQTAPHFMANLKK